MRKNYILVEDIIREELMVEYYLRNELLRLDEGPSIRKLVSTLKNVFNVIKTFGTKFDKSLKRVTDLLRSVTSKDGAFNKMLNLANNSKWSGKVKIIRRSLEVKSRVKTVENSWVTNIEGHDVFLYDIACVHVLSFYKDALKNAVQLCVSWTVKTWSTIANIAIAGIAEAALKWCLKQREFKTLALAFAKGVAMEIAGTAVNAATSVADSKRVQDAKVNARYKEKTGSEMIRTQNGGYISAAEATRKAEQAKAEWRSQKAMIDEFVSICKNDPYNGFPSKWQMNPFSPTKFGYGTDPYQTDRYGKFIYASEIYLLLKWYYGKKNPTVNVPIQQPRLQMPIQGYSDNTVNTYNFNVRQQFGR